MLCSLKLRGHQHQAHINSLYIHCDGMYRTYNDILKITADILQSAVFRSAYSRILFSPFRSLTVIRHFFLFAEWGLSSCIYSCGRFPSRFPSVRFPLTHHRPLSRVFDLLWLKELTAIIYLAYLLQWTRCSVTLLKCHIYWSSPCSQLCTDLKGIMW